MELMDYLCKNCKCTWRCLVYKNQIDGIACPCCHGNSVAPKNHKQVADRAFYVRDQILGLDLEHCRDLTPEQVRTVLSIGDGFAMPGVDKKESNLQGAAKEQEPLLTITLDDINSVPTVHYRGEEVTKKLDVAFDWKSRSEYFYKTYIKVEHWDDESQGMNTKVIQHNHPFSEDDD